MEAGVMERIVARFKVRVTKKNLDDRKYLCGEPAQTDDDGREFFIIPAHQADYIRQIYPQYEVGEPYDPGTQQVAPQIMEELVEKAVEEKKETEGFKCDVCGHISPTPAGLASHKRFNHPGESKK